MKPLDPYRHFLAAALALALLSAPAAAEDPASVPLSTEALTAAAHATDDLAGSFTDPRDTNGWSGFEEHIPDYVDGVPVDKTKAVPLVMDGELIGFDLPGINNPNRAILADQKAKEAYRSFLASNKLNPGATNALEEMARNEAATRSNAPSYGILNLDPDAMPGLGETEDQKPRGKEESTPESPAPPWNFTPPAEKTVAEVKQALQNLAKRRQEWTSPPVDREREDRKQGPAEPEAISPAGRTEEPENVAGRAFTPETDEDWTKVAENLKGYHQWLASGEGAGNLELPDPSTTVAGAVSRFVRKLGAIAQLVDFEALSASAAGRGSADSAAALFAYSVDGAKINPDELHPLEVPDHFGGTRLALAENVRPGR